MSDDPFGFGIGPSVSPEKTDTVKAESPTPPSPKKAAGTQKPAQPEKQRRGTGLASGGKLIMSTDDYPDPGLPTWENRDDEYSFTEFQEVDFEDLSRINFALNQVRVKFYRIGRKLKDAQRRLSDAKAAYNRRMRRELVNMSGGTDKTRIAMAEIACEEWENDVAVATQLVAEITNEQRIVSKDLDVLESLANNARAQIKIM